VWDAADYPMWRARLRPELAAHAIRNGYGFEEVVVGACGGVHAAARILKARGVMGVVALASRAADAWKAMP
jgi:hypothetical protein